MTLLARSAAVLLLLTGAACGPNPPEVVAHGLAVVPLEAAPVGDPVPVYTDIRPGAWQVEIEKTWTESRAGGPGRPGFARLTLRIETRAEADGMRTWIEVAVLEATGLASGFVGGFDGLKVSLPHAEDGRADASRIRFESQAPPRARMFLRGLWLAGLAGATPWFPNEALRLGDAWPRKKLGEEARAMAAGAARPRFDGGGRVAAIETVDGETALRVEFDGLFESDSAAPNEAVSQGYRDRGAALFRARDGLPLEWTYRQEVRIRHVRRGIRTSRDIVLDVEARTSAVAPRDASLWGPGVLQVQAADSRVGSPDDR